MSYVGTMWVGMGRNWGLHFVSFVLHRLLHFYFVLAGRQSSATHGYSIHTLRLITCSIKEKLYNHVNTVIWNNIGKIHSLSIPARLRPRYPLPSPSSSLPKNVSIILKRLSSNLSPATYNPLPVLNNILLLLEPENSCYDPALTSWLTQGFDDSECQVNDCDKRELVELYWPNRILLLTINRYLGRIGYIVVQYVSWRHS